jgi:hypothetical protein
MTAVRHSGGKTRRRGDALEHALLDAAWDELLLARTPPSEGTLMEIVDDVYLPLVRPS